MTLICTKVENYCPSIISNSEWALATWYSKGNRNTHAWVSGRTLREPCSALFSQPDLARLPTHNLTCATEVYLLVVKAFGHRHHKAHFPQEYSHPLLSKWECHQNEIFPMRLNSGLVRSCGLTCHPFHSHILGGKFSRGDLNFEWRVVTFQAWSFLKLTFDPLPFPGTSQQLLPGDLHHLLRVVLQLYPWNEKPKLLFVWVTSFKNREI